MELKRLTYSFAQSIYHFCRSLPGFREAQRISDQLFRAGTSAGSNYRAACRARSRREFAAKLGIVEEEADESMFWLEFLKDVKVGPQEENARLRAEAHKILAMTVKSIKTTRTGK